MRWVSYLSPSDGRTRAGLLGDDEYVYGLAEPRRLTDLLGDDGALMRSAARRAQAEPADLIFGFEARLRAPVPDPPRIRCAAPEAAPGVPPAVLRPSAVHGPDDGYAHELEPGAHPLPGLAVAAVVGRAAQDVTAEEAAAVVAGYLIMLVWRDLARPERAPTVVLGPALVTPDELAGAAAGGEIATVSVNDAELARFGGPPPWLRLPALVAAAAADGGVLPGEVVGDPLRGAPVDWPRLAPGDEVRTDVAGLGEISVSLR
ncbi:fumarylacetoacetate hydrolase family protein [Allonocardiopsis opalescens]|uniref:Fumarylacetoacetase-like protein n=1 Tax=Allonocardiopsis opalescens TaxID=1144618 RepID=A0A2T0Q0J2_9ACTN|nr:fumarylacetoacetate hydrolase family protein [Allonocardiopsis opalescens]PRX97193.1 fumarylacetoacetase-like protein [Allonocardiopsis opalescens]